MREVAAVESGEYLPPEPHVRPRSVNEPAPQPSTKARIRANQIALQTKAAACKRIAQASLFWGIALCVLGAFAGPAAVVFLPVGMVLLVLAAVFGFEAARYRSLGSIGPED